MSGRSRTRWCHPDRRRGGRPARPRSSAKRTSLSKWSVGCALVTAATNGRHPPCPVSGHRLVLRWSTRRKLRGRSSSMIDRTYGALRQCPNSNTNITTGRGTDHAERHLSRSARRPDDHVTRSSDNEHRRSCRHGSATGQASRSRCAFEWLLGAVAAARPRQADAATSSLGVVHRARPDRRT